jgi:pimeloyl-ACP methyl ester carboxylesterase
MTVDFRPSLWVHRLVPWAAALGALHLSLVAALWWGQEGLLFHPEPLPLDHRFDFGPDVHETWVEVPGARINALHLRLPDPEGVVLFLHGNAGNLETWFTAAPAFRRANFDLVMPDYRGFGKSTGRIEGQAQLEADVRAVWDAVSSAYQGKRRVIYGRSLGTGLAALLAAQVQPDLTVLVSPYQSMAVLAAEKYPWVPGAVLRYPLRTDWALRLVKTPVLLFHGDRDTLIPPVHSVRLQELIPGATLRWVAGAGHDDLHGFSAYLGALGAALASLGEGDEGAQPRSLPDPTGAADPGGQGAGDR